LKVWLNYRLITFSHRFCILYQKDLKESKSNQILCQTIFLYLAEFCTGCCGDFEFEILSKDGSVRVGKITKQWSGLIREAFTDSDRFRTSFPLDLDVHIKAILLGACFLFVWSQKSLIISQFESYFYYSRTTFFSKILATNRAIAPKYSNYFLKYIRHSILRYYSWHVKKFDCISCIFIRYAILYPNQCRLF